MQSRREILRMLSAGPVALCAGPLLKGCGENTAAANPMNYPAMDAPLKLSGSPDRPWWVRGNYSPVADEIESYELDVIGNLPPEINGAFLRKWSKPPCR